MFEENAQSQPAQGQAPAAQPAQEPSDMFASVDQPASVTPAEGPTQPQSPGAGYTFEEDEEPKPWYMQKKFIVLLLGVVLLLIVIIFGVQFALRFFAPAPASVTAPATLQPTEALVPEAPAPETPSTEEEAVPEQPTEQTTPTTEEAGGADTDSDGLTDSEEQTLGTNITLTDTDGDELSDREEFRVFGTDPLKPDTDGDTYLDGAEVKNGYNPKGEGTLFTVPTESQQQ